MDSHLSVVASAFRTMGVVLGAPSLVAFLYFGWASLRLHLLTPPASAPSTAAPGSLTGIIETTSKIFGGIFGLLGAAGQWVATAIAASAFLLLVTAVTLFFTGRGLHAHSGLARTVACLLSLAILLVSLVGFLSMRRGPASLVPLLLAAWSGYCVWVMVRRFV